MRILALFALAALVAGPVLAQSLPDWAEPSGPAAPEAQMMPPPAPGGGGGSAPTQVPLDGGLSLLALAGVGLAARKLRQSR